MAKTQLIQQLMTMGNGFHTTIFVTMRNFPMMRNCYYDLNYHFFVTHYDQPLMWEKFDRTYKNGEYYSIIYIIVYYMKL